MRQKLPGLCSGKTGLFAGLPRHLLRHEPLFGESNAVQALDNISRLALLQILEDRYGKKSIIITSQLPVVKWYDYIAEPTLADAIMDRLAVNAHRVELKGESLRKKKTEKKE